MVNLDSTHTTGFRMTLASLTAGSSTDLPIQLDSFISPGTLDHPLDLTAMTRMLSATMAFLSFSPSRLQRVMARPTRSSFAPPLAATSSSARRKLCLRLAASWIAMHVPWPKVGRHTPAASPTRTTGPASSTVLCRCPDHMTLGGLSTKSFSAASSTVSQYRGRSSFSGSPSCPLFLAHADTGASVMLAKKARSSATEETPPGFLPVAGSRGKKKIMYRIPPFSDMSHPVVPSDFST
mmetsp:Transcript_24036/g.60840  ORF Transcript_24036/g.60840 Transcript_24036/m.60840 type:complete len:237 (+) Transcript_24036:116-826(+)